MSDGNPSSKYQAVLESAIDKTFRNLADATRFRSLLAEVSHPRGWEYRIGLAIIKLCGQDLDRIREFVDARHEHRDIVCMAEYPLQGAAWKLRDNAPEKYRDAIEQDLKNYNAFLMLMTHSAEKTVTELTGPDIVELYKAGRRNFCDLEFVQYLELANCELPKIEFRNCWLDGNFSESNLASADFTGSCIKPAVFSRANLTNTIFCYCAIDATEWDDAIFEGTNFYGSSAHGHIYSSGELPP